MKHINNKEKNKNTQQYNYKLYHSQGMSKVLYMEQNYNTQPSIISKYKTMFSNSTLISRKNTFTLPVQFTKNGLLIFLFALGATWGNAQCTRTISNTSSSSGCSSIDYVFWTGPEKFYEDNLIFTECGNTAIISGTMKSHNTGNIWSLNVTLSGKTTTPPSGSPKAHQCSSYSASGWTYYTTTTGSIKNLKPILVIRLLLEVALRSK